MISPIQVGWYWFRTDDQDTWKIVEVRSSEMFASLVVDIPHRNHGLPLSQFGNRCQWVGPLKPPQEEKKEDTR